MNSKQLSTIEIVIRLIWLKYDTYLNCIDHKSTKSWYFDNYLVENLKSFKYKPCKYNLSHWTGKTAWVTNLLILVQNVFRETSPIYTSSFNYL